MLIVGLDRSLLYNGGEVKGEGTEPSSSDERWLTLPVGLPSRFSSSESPIKARSAMSGVTARLGIILGLILLPNVVITT